MAEHKAFYLKMLCTQKIAQLICSKKNWARDVCRTMSVGVTLLVATTAPVCDDSRRGKYRLSWPTERTLIILEVLHPDRLITARTAPR